MANAEIAAIRQMIAQFPRGLSVEETRQAYDSAGAYFPKAADVKLEPQTIGAARAEWSSTPGADNSRAILFLHGGGYVIGSLVSHRHLAIELGRAAGTRTLALDYRLAPEAPFPAAVDDAMSGYRFLLDQGLKPSSIAIAGDSAGGGLTVAVLLAARDAGLAQPACGFLMSPWIDLEGHGGSMKAKAAEDPIVAETELLQFAAAYVGEGNARNPLAAPLYANLSRLAPLLIHVGSAEVLLDDSIRLAGLAGAAEVPVRLEVWPEMLHVWHFFYPMLADGRRAVASAGAFIREKMNSPPR